MVVTAKNAIISVLQESIHPMTTAQIEQAILSKYGYIPSSSIRSSLSLQSKKEDGAFIRLRRGVYQIRSAYPHASIGFATLYNGDAFSVMAAMQDESIHAIVTDPPYGLVEYTEKERARLKSKSKGGVWREPPSFDGHDRSPLPRFTTLTEGDKKGLYDFFEAFAESAFRILKPGGNVAVATNPLVVHIVASALERGGLEPRGQIIRLVQTMRGGDRPKGREKDFDSVSVMPRSQYEPWIIMRKPIKESTIAKNLEVHGTGGWRRISNEQPFGDVIRSRPTSVSEKKIAPHPSLKPQALMREIVRASLPLSKGVILDPFMGSGSTLAAANYLGISSIGIEIDSDFYELALKAIHPLSELDARISAE